MMKLDAQKVKENIEKASKRKSSGKKSYMQRLLDAQAEMEEKQQNLVLIWMI